MTSSVIDRDVISRTKTEWVRHRDDVWRSVFLSSLLDSLCHVGNKMMYVLEWQTVSALTWVLFWCLFPPMLRNSGKYQNNPFVSAEPVCHSSTYIILYIFGSGNSLLPVGLWRCCLQNVSLFVQSWVVSMCDTFSDLCNCFGQKVLLPFTSWGRDKMAAISQTIS